jgi:hypothetical protein
MSMRKLKPDRHKHTRRRLPQPVKAPGPCKHDLLPLQEIQMMVANVHL